MQEIKGLVSIIIPVYKTGIIIEETINSVINQTYRDFEIIAIDDGSNDDTVSYLEKFADVRIKIIKQHNQGMAQTRNNGIKIANGEFILFLDHDDLIAEDFLQSRVDCLNKNPEIGFVGSTVRTFPDNPKNYLSVADNIEQELLFFLPIYLSTPSSYLVRRNILEDNNITFNQELSSTADRFFLLQLNKVTKGKRIDKGMLFYRISASGFSQKITLSLIDDNEKFFYALKKYSLMPTKNLSRFKSLYFFMLAGGYYAIGKYGKVFTYLIKSLLSNPFCFFERLIFNPSPHLENS